MHRATQAPAQERKAQGRQYRNKPLGRCRVARVAQSNRARYTVSFVANHDFGIQRHDIGINLARGKNFCRI